MLVVGVTGGIGSGKTTVTDLFAAQGIEIVDADVIARSIFDSTSATGQQALGAVAAKFGPQALLVNGELDRAWLRQHIFTHPEAKQWLNELTHPLIRQQILEQLKQATSPYVMLSAPLLVENRLTQLCDRVLVVDVDEHHQRQRTLIRDQVDASQVDAIMAAQASRKERLAAADNVIDNNGEPAALTKQVERLHELYLRLALAKADNN